MSHELTVLARNPQEMAVAQKALVAWADARLQKAKVDHGELEDNYHIAVERKWKSSLLKRKAADATKKVEFWEKVKAALEAGYCIVPALPVDVFAIRTTRKKPTPEYGRSSGDREQMSNRPALGDGRYVDSLPILDNEGREVTNKDGETEELTHYWADSFDDVEFPFTMVQAQVMDETGKAMAEKIFDDFGVLPQRRQKGDPIVVGRIHYPGQTYSEYGFRKTINFLIMWWIDTEAL